MVGYVSDFDCPADSPISDFNFQGIYLQSPHHSMPGGSEPGGSDRLSVSTS